MKHAAQALAIALFAILLFLPAAAQDAKYQTLLDNLDFAIQSFWQSGGRFQHAADGTLVGWPMRKTVDGTMWEVDDDVAANTPLVSIMEPGVSGTGMAFLRAYEHTGNKLYLEYAIEAGKTLLSLQRDLETHPNGSPKPRFESGGFIDYAVIINDGSVSDENGHWTIPRVTSGGAVTFVTREQAPVVFDDSISSNGPMFLLELYDSIKNLDFSSDVVDPLEGINKEEFLQGATKFFNLVEAYRTDFEIKKSDFAGITVGYVAAKKGEHPFNAYLAALPDHNLNNGQAFKPYSNGGIPEVAEIAIDQMKNGQGYGALAAGYTLHKQINDNDMSSLLLFLLRYYEVTGDDKAWNNLKLQLTWLVDVFQDYGNRSWCQQYHVLDDKCAPARPFEPPAFAILESRDLIPTMGYIEKTMEEKYHTTDSGVRTALEDAIYYIHRSITYDEDTPADDGDKVFRFYAITDYDQPTANTHINSNDPVFSCDYYYPTNPYNSECMANYAQYNYYLIKEPPEFQAPFVYGFSDIGHGNIYRLMIEDACLNDPTRGNYSGCLNLNKQYANDWKYWERDWRYWSYWRNTSIDDYLARYSPNPQGFWTENSEINGENRAVIDTFTFRYNTIGIARFLGQNKTQITDSDSDGLLDSEETAIGTDAFYPDSDRDGISDGKDPFPLNTCNNNGTCETGETTESCQSDCGQPEECVDTEKLVGEYIPQWKRGEIRMLTLMQKIAARNAGTGC